MAESFNGYLRATRPWNSADAGTRRSIEIVPQQEISVCLSCELCADACDHCDGRGNVANPRGRPRIEIDTNRLRELLALRKRNAEMCADLGCSEWVLKKAKRELLKEENK